MWPAVTKIVGENKIGTAYGFMFSVQNLGLWGLPILIGVVLDSSNPQYQTELNNSQYVDLQQKEFYTGTYHAGGDELGKDKELNVKYIVHADSCTGEILWKSIHKVKSDENGNYDIELGEHDVINIAEFAAVDLNEHELGIKIENIEDEDSPQLITKDTLALSNPDNPFSSLYKQDGQIVDDERFDAMITVYDWNTKEVVYQEKQSLRTEENGEFKVKIGNGVVQQAGYKYFDLEKGNYCAEVLTPLDYTNSMLMLSVLGLFGLVFAFFLKREDKVSGYGLEKPNKVE
jgi:hypothetical protein